MRESKTNLENIINSSFDEIKQKMLSICESNSKTDLDFTSATDFIGQIKDLVSELGCQVVKEYFESRDEQSKYIDSKDKRHLLKAKSAKKIITSLGNINITRNYYQHRSGGKSIIPLDRKLGVENDILMPDVKETVLFSSAFNTPEETSRLLAKCSFIKVHATQIKRAIKTASELIENPRSTIMENVRKKEPVPESDILVCSLDGVNVLLKQEGKKMGRPTERPVKESLNKLSAYKNAMCGSISNYKLTENNGVKESTRISSKYIARMPEDCYPTFKNELEKELKKYDLIPTIRLVITDAHKSITGYLKDNPAYKGYHRIIDFFHASEHLSHMTEAIFGKSSANGKEWYINYRNTLKHEKQGVSKLIRSAEYYIRILSIKKTGKMEAQKHLRYFKRYEKFMAYADYLERGWPIGSGVIEAACKSVVKQRMCRSGQRWSIAGGQGILDLRATVKSERWDSFWNEFSQEYYTNMAA